MLYSILGVSSRAQTVRVPGTGFESRTLPCIFSSAYTFLKQFAFLYCRLVSSAHFLGPRRRRAEIDKEAFKKSDSYKHNSWRFPRPSLLHASSRAYQNTILLLSFFKLTTGAVYEEFLFVSNSLLINNSEINKNLLFRPQKKINSSMYRSRFMTGWHKSSQTIEPLVILDPETRVDLDCE